MNKLEEKMQGQSTEMLKEIVVKANEKYEDGANTVFETALDILEKRMEEKEFIKFCEKL